MIPLPNEIRHLQRDKIDTFFSDHIQRKNFYSQAKEGKLGENFDEEQEIMQKYFEKIRDNK